MKQYLVLNGPNLGRLGKREPSIYGTATLDDLENRLRAVADELGVGVSCFQSNGEGALIDRIEAFADEAEAAGIIVNAGGFTHTSVALRDALAGCGLPAMEVHLSNVYQRETFRHHSYLSAVCAGVIAGLGFAGYEAALRYLVSNETD